MGTQRNEKLDDYVEGRFCFTERISQLSKPRLIQLINKMLNDGDEKTLLISDEELEELLNDYEGEKND